MRRIYASLYYFVFLIVGTVAGLAIIGGFGGIFSTMLFVNGKLFNSATATELTRTLTDSATLAPSLTAITNLNLFGVKLELDGDYTHIALVLSILIFTLGGYLVRKLITGFTKKRFSC